MGGRVYKNFLDLYGNIFDNILFICVFVNGFIWLLLMNNCIILIGVNILLIKYSFRNYLYSW